MGALENDLINRSIINNKKLFTEDFFRKENEKNKKWLEKQSIAGLTQWKEVVKQFGQLDVSSNKQSASDEKNQSVSSPQKIPVVMTHQSQKNDDKKEHLKESQYADCDAKDVPYIIQSLMDTLAKSDIVMGKDIDVNVKYINGLPVLEIKVYTDKGEAALKEFVDKMVNEGKLRLGGPMDYAKLRAEPPKTPAAAESAKSSIPQPGELPSLRRK